MALLFAEHTLTFTDTTEPVQGDGSVEVPAGGSTHSVTGQLEPMTSQAAFEAFGVELRRPHKFYYEIEDEASVKVGYKATKGSRVFEVSAPPMKNEAGGDLEDLDHMVCVLEEREFA